MLYMGCQLQNVAEGNYQVTLPSWRLDLEREIDLIEEIARVYGYNRFANTLPAFPGIVRELPHGSKEAAIRQTLLAGLKTTSYPAPSALLLKRLPLRLNRA